MKLSAIQIHILKILSEADEENIPTIVNTIYTESPRMDKERLLLQINSALEELHGMGLIAYSRYVNKGEPRWVTIPEDEISSVLPLQNCLEWNDETSLWRWKAEQFGKERVVVTLEEKGRKAIPEYLADSTSE